MPSNLLESADSFKNAYTKLRQFICEDDSKEISRAGILHVFELW